MSSAQEAPNYESRLAAALTRRRYDSTIKPLQDWLALHFLLDADFCKVISEELATGGRAWEVHRATPDLWQQIPDGPGLYMFVFIPHLKFRMANPEGETRLPKALYVGRAGSDPGGGTLRGRYRGEYKKYVSVDPEILWEGSPAAERKAVLRKYLNIWPLQYWYLEIAERETIGRLESGLIKLLNPPLNLQGVARLRPVGPAGPAFEERGSEMSNKTFIPAFRAKVGDWQYYICTMKYAEVARQVQFAYELAGNAELGTMIQRGISDRTKEITEYLLQSEHRFLGSLIIAAWGGAPDYQPIGMSDPDGLLTGIDQSFGVLTFDGTQQYFALDGQHRLKAIKDAIKQKPELGLEDICVLLVSHFNTEDGRLKTRRLFTNINRNAKITSSAENIALDEDYGISIITRRLLESHDFLKQPGLVKVFQRTGDQGEIALAGSNIPKGDPKAFTTISVLHEWLKDLAFHLPKEVSDKGVRPTDPELENAYEVIAKRVDELVDHCGDLKTKLKEAVSARDVRAPKDKEPQGHAFMRPVVQRAVTRTIRQLIDQEVLTWEEALSRLSKLDWHIGNAPWIAVYAETSNQASGKMLGGKENTNLLSDLLRCHIAPLSKQAVKKARREYKEIRGQAYPFTEEQLFEYLGAEDESPSSETPVS